MHMHSHAFDDINDKGILLIYDSLLNEPMHGPLKESYLLRTNFKNADGQVCLYMISNLLQCFLHFCGLQILQADHRLFVSAYLRTLIDYEDKASM